VPADASTRSRFHVLQLGQPRSFTGLRHFCIYFGGVLYYLDDRQSFVERYVNLFSAKFIVVQDLCATDLSSLRKHFRVVEDRRFQLDISVPEEEWEPGWDSRTIGCRQVLACAV